MTPHPVCYAERLLNPFRGVMNIIEYRGAEAVTTDGRHWDIYVRDTALVADLADSHRIQTSDIRYGRWSQQEGLRRGALYPSDDFKQLEMLGAIVYEYLLDHCDDIPFPLRDRYELWLLDDEHAPLALLGSRVDAQALELDAPLDWRVGQECRQGFHPHQQGIGATTDCAGQLIRQVNERAGCTPRAQWFQREDDGSGRGLAGINLDDTLVGRLLSRTDFPPFFVSEPDDVAQRALLNAFFDWQAPCLLLLPHLSDAERLHFERQAARRALAVDRHHRLYPKVLDAEMVRAARVEALLRADEAQQTRDEDAMATYYIELNVTRTN